jgi:hypothetical protein
VPHINVNPRQATQILAIQTAQPNIKFTQATQVPQTNIKSLEATQVLQMSIISMEAIQAAHFLDMNTMPMVPMGSQDHTILILATQICTKELKLTCLARTSTRLPGQQ